MARLCTIGVAVLWLSRALPADTIVEGPLELGEVSARPGEEAFPATALVSTISPPGAFLRGDASHDGEINISDPVTTLNFLFRGTAEIPCEDAADDDGELTIGDAIVTLSYLFLGGTVIRAPGTRYPWFDPTPDDLGCLGG